MKCSFIVPPCYDNSQPAERSAGCTRIVYPMINIYELTAAAAVRECGHQVEYHDFVTATGAKKGRRDFEAFLEGDNSQAYLIWTVNLSVDSDLEAIAHLRRHHPSAPVILLGPGALYYMSKMLADSNTYIVRGEPEATLCELLEALEKGTGLAAIKGLSWIDPQGRRVNNPTRPLLNDLDSLPLPARDLLQGRAYHNPKLKTGPYTTAFTSRNCPFRCIYCVPSSLTFAREMEYRAHNGGHKPTIAMRSPRSVEKEIAALAAEGYRAIGFMDDNFIWNEDRTRQLCDIMRRHGMVWGCQARVDAITEPIAKMLGESGCRYVDLGIESFDPGILQYIHKGITPRDIYRAVGLLKKYNVPVKLNVLIGSSPLETPQTVRDTLRQAKRLDVDQVMFNIVSPFPGTEYYNVCKKNGWIKGGEYRPTDVQHESILELPHISSKQMERLLFLNNISYFLSPRFIVKQLRRFKSWSEFSAAATGLRKKLFH